MLPPRCRPFGYAGRAGPDRAGPADGATQSSIARIEAADGLPALGMLARLARATGTPLRPAAPGITGVDLGGTA